MMLVTKTINTKIKDAAQARDCQFLKGEIAKLYTKTAREAVGTKGLLDQNCENNAVNNRGAVSPDARAIARVVPVTIAGSAVGNTTEATV